MIRSHVVLLLLAAAPVSSHDFPRRSAPARPIEPRLAEVYAPAVAKLLGEPGNQEFVLLPTAAREGLTIRQRGAAGEPHSASLTVASEVARRLRALGYRGALGARAHLTTSGALQLVLGQLRFEPASDPAFARVAIGVIGADGSYQHVESLLKHERDGWRALNVEVASAAIAPRAAHPPRTSRTAAITSTRPTSAFTRANRAA